VNCLINRRALEPPFPTKYDFVYNGEYQEDWECEVDDRIYWAAAFGFDRLVEEVCEDWKDSSAF